MANTNQSEMTHREAAESCGLRLEHYGHGMQCHLFDGARIVFDGHMCDSWDFMRAQYGLAAEAA